MSSSLSPENETTLPPLTPYEARRYGDLAARMDVVHSGFKREFQSLYDLADGSFNKRGMSLNMFLQSALRFKDHLHLHHTVEEREVFPVLAKKMPSFGNDERHRISHQGIHDGLNSLVALVSRVKSDPTTYSPTEMRACLDGFRDVLMRHLDEEVHDLRAENMRRYWTLDEVDYFPW